MNRDNTPGILVSGQDLGGSVDRGVKGGQWGAPFVDINVIHCTPSIYHFLQSTLTLPSSFVFIAITFRDAIQIHSLSRIA